VRVVRVATPPAGRNALVACESGEGRPEARAAPPQPGPFQDCNLTPSGVLPVGTELRASLSISHVFASNGDLPQRPRPDVDLSHSSFKISRH
jgi:hypothetical protein